MMDIPGASPAEVWEAAYPDGTPGRRRFADIEPSGQAEIARYIGVAQAPLVARIEQLTALSNQLKALGALVRPEEGSLSLVLYADGSWYMNLEMWGSNVSRCQHGRPFDIDLTEANKYGPEAAAEVKQTVERLNACLKELSS